MANLPNKILSCSSYTELESEMDERDRRILDLVQRDADLPQAELARRGGPSAPPLKGALDQQERKFRAARREGKKARTPLPPPQIAPADVHDVLARHMLADGYDLVLDLGKSRGRRLYDALSGRTYLDMFSCFATLPLGLNHPKMLEPEFLAKLQRAALANPSNSDAFTVHLAEFVDTSGRL